MTALLRYSVDEAVRSLARGWRTGLLSIGVIAAAVFVAGAVLLVSVNADRIIERLTATAELTIYLKADAGPAGREAVAGVLATHPAVGSSNYVGAEAALERFKRELPELAALVGSLENNPLPAAFEVRLREGQDEEGLRSLVQALEGTQAVEDVRYDRRIIDRMMGGLRLLRRGGALLAAIMVFTALVTITSVLRLAYLSRRDEIEVLFLMGLPPAAIRGPFVVEGMLQTAAGAAIALVLLAVAFGMVHARIGSDVGQAFGVGVAAFLSPGMTVLVLITSIVVGAVAGCAAAWKEP